MLQRRRRKAILFNRPRCPNPKSVAPPLIQDSLQVIPPVHRCRSVFQRHPSRRVSRNRPCPPGIWSVASGVPRHCRPGFVTVPQQHRRHHPSGPLPAACHKCKPAEERSRPPPRFRRHYGTRDRNLPGCAHTRRASLLQRRLLLQMQRKPNQGHSWTPQSGLLRVSQRVHPPPLRKRILHGFVRRAAPFVA